MKLLIRITVLLTAMLSLMGANAGAEDHQKKLTLMIYMCGSNLESSYGSASSDVQEMLEAKVDGREISVLLMTGGSGFWHIGFDPSRTLISEIGSRGMRTVWSAERMNMGEKETLTRFLRFGVDRYPSDEYAVILWDHGCGPLEGICWDEAFPSDRLTVQELSEALADARLEKKLKWIGLDACLMNSLETACALQPYAEYLIASQETEVTSGWDYGFLGRLKAGADIAETSRLIIDSYLRTKVKKDELLTLSCLDLSKAADASNALGEVFLNWDPENYAELSEARASARAFGRGMTETGEDGYDLVDALDLMSRMKDSSEQAERFQRAAAGMIVYAGSNRETVHGLSVYFPFENKAKLLSGWREKYASLPVSGAYKGFVRSFGDFLLGDARTDWSRLVPGYSGICPDGTHSLRLPLTDQQRDHLVSAELLILQETTSDAADRVFLTLIGLEPAVVSEDGVLRADYRNRKVSVVDSQGRPLVDTVSFTLDQGGDSLISPALYLKTETGLADPDLVFFYLSGNASDGVPEITQIKVNDSMTNSSTNRIPLLEEEYDQVLFWTWQKKMPEIPEQQVLPDFFHWEDDRDAVLATSFRLPRDWHFEYSGLPVRGRRLWALFRLTDIQHNTCCSVPVLLDPPDQETVLPPLRSETESWTITPSLSVLRNPDNYSLQINLRIHNQADVQRLFHFSDLVLNGHRLVQANGDMTVPAGASGTCRLEILREELRDLPLLETVGFSCRIQSGENEGEKQTLQFSADGYDLSEICGQLSEISWAEADGVRCGITDPRFDGRMLSFGLFVRNESAKEFQLSNECGFNRKMQYTLYGREAVPAGCEMLLNCNAEPDEWLWSNLFPPNLPGDEILDVVIPDGLNGLDAAAVSLITVWNAETGAAYDLLPKDPVDMSVPYSQNSWALYFGIVNMLDHALPEEHQASVTAKNEDLEAAVEWVVLGDRVLGLRTLFRNKTTQALTLTVDGISVNGSSVEKRETFLIRPSLSTRRFIRLNLADEDVLQQGIRDIRLRLSSSERGEKIEYRMELSPPLLQNGSPYTVADGNTAAGTFQILSAPLPTAAPADDFDVTDSFYRKRIRFSGEKLPRMLWMTAPLTEAQADNFDSGLLALVRKTDSDYIEILSAATMGKNAEGRIGAEISGLMLCVQDHPEYTLMLRKESIEEGVWKATALPSLIFMTELSDESFTLSGIQCALDVKSGSAEVLSVETDKPPLERDRIQWVQLIPSEYLLPNTSGEPAPHVSQLQHRMNLDFLWFLNAPMLRLGGTPLCLELDEIPADDHVYMMFSVKEKDGTMYSLPLVPYGKNGV